MGASYRFLARNRFLSIQQGLVKEWRARDNVAFTQLVDFTGVESERSRRAAAGLLKPSETAFVVDSLRGLCGTRAVMIVD